MWETVLDMIYLGFVSSFGWFADILSAAPGAWNTIFTVFVILALSRFLLGPLLGASFSGQSDRAKIKSMAKQQRLSNAAKEYNKNR